MTIDDVIAEARRMAEAECRGSEEIVMSTTVPTFAMAVFIDALAFGHIEDPSAFAMELRFWLHGACRDLSADPHMQAIEAQVRAYSPVANVAPIAEVKP